MASSSCGSRKMAQQTLVLCTPDAVSRGVTFEISSQFEKRAWPHELTMVACRMFGLSKGFRQPRGKPEGPQHFAFPEVSRETRRCLVLHSVSLEFPSGNSQVSLSLRAGLGQNLGQN